MSRRDLVAWLSHDLCRSSGPLRAGLVDDLIELSRGFDGAWTPAMVGAGRPEENHLRGVFELAYGDMDVVDAAAVA